MAIYQFERIARDVRISMEQNATSSPLAGIGDVDTLSLEEVVRSKVSEAVRRVHLSAPVHLLETGHNLDGGVFWDGTGSGHLLLPDDFMRLVVFQMSDWSRPVFQPIEGDDPRYAMQRSRFKGIRGTPQRPVCAIVMRPEGLSLEFYACKDETAHVTKGSYLPYSHMDEDGGIDICEKCYPAVVYETASLVSASYGEEERRRMFDELSKSILI